MSALARDRSERPDLDTLQQVLDDWASRWSEPEWPVPALGEYVKAQDEAASQTGEGPTKAYDTSGLAKADMAHSEGDRSDLESGDRPTRQSDELDPELAKLRGG
jgi:hypothetical protein